MANFGDILSSLNIPASYSIRRNSADDAFESFLPLVMAGSDKEVLFNSSGAIGASPALKFDTDSLIVNYQLRSPDGVFGVSAGSDLIVKAGNADGNWGGYLYLSPGNDVYAPSNMGFIFLGTPDYNLNSLWLMCDGVEDDIDLQIWAKGSGMIALRTSGTVFLNGADAAIGVPDFVFTYTDTVIRGIDNATIGLVPNLSIIGHASTAGNTDGGNVKIYGGLPAGTGSRGNVYFGNGSAGYLPARSSEIDIIHFDASTGKILYGTIEQGSINSSPVARSYFPDDMNLEEFIGWNQAAGRVFGGNITPNGDGTVAITAGAGVIKALDGGPESCPCTGDLSQLSKVSYIEWDAVASLALTDNAYNYIYIDGDDGLVKVTTNFYSISFTRAFTVGRAYRTGTNVVARLCGTNIWNFNRRVQLFGEERFPVERASGLIHADAGSRQFTVTSGIIWAELVNRFTTNAKLAADNFTYWYRDGAGGWTTASTNLVNNTQFDNNEITGPDAFSGGPGRWRTDWVYVVHDGTVHVVMGQQETNSLAAAETVLIPAAIPGLLGAYASFIGRIIIQKDTTPLYITSAFTTQLGYSQVTNHNDLGALNTGDYLHFLASEKDVFDTNLLAVVQNTILGRITASTGEVEQLTGANVRTITDTAQKQSSKTDNTAGRGVIVGGFGLGATSENLDTPSDDADALRINGLWRTVATTTGHMFGSNIAQIIHLGQSANYGVQLGLQTQGTDPVIRARVLNNNVWQTARTLWHDGNLPIEITTPAADDVLVYNSVSLKWENSAVLGDIAAALDEIIGDP